MAKIISIYNLKGGCSKTTSVASFACELASMGKKVLVVDSDQQENLSFSFGITPSLCRYTIFQLFLAEMKGIEYEKDLSQFIVHKDYEDFTIDVIPGSVDMANIDEEIFKIKIDRENAAYEVKTAQKKLEDYVHKISSDPTVNHILSAIKEGSVSSDDLALYSGFETLYEMVRSKTEVESIKALQAELAEAQDQFERTKNAYFLLKNILEGVKDKYDYILLDLPPALSSVTRCALACSDSIIIPVLPEPFGVAGLMRVVAAIKEAKDKTNPALTVNGLIFTQVEPNRQISEQIMENMRKQYAEVLYIYDTVIPRATDVNRAFATKQPLKVYSKNSKPRISYEEATKELLKREEALG